MKKKIICATIIVICILIAFGATVTIDWLYDTFGHLSMDEIIFHIKVPMEGTNTDIIFTFIKECLWKVIIPTIIISFVLIYPMIKDLKFINKINTSERTRTIVVSLFISISILAVSVDKILKTTDIKEYITNQKDNSTFIASEYVKPQETKIEFPEEKRNLIYIFLESMETTYYSVEEGGLSEENLIPEIAKISKENINFTNNDEIGGAYSIGQVLQDNGYNNFLLLGSDATFAGRKNLFKQHGNYEIWDFDSAIAENKVNEKIWWGYTDDLLFEYAKEKILYLAKQKEPFNFTMLTADTHFPDGYKCNECPNKWDEQYKNVISCSSKRVGEFIKWIQKQEFYDSTTIVIAGDHLTMQSNFFELEEGQEYDKKVVSVIINSAVETQNTKNRLYSTIDLYPTTLASLGATIEGNRLALGTNLFSDEKTLIEKYGLTYVNDELSKNSRFYDNNILISK